jgi:hypothetical protein
MLLKKFPTKLAQYQRAHEMWETNFLNAEELRRYQGHFWFYKWRSTQLTLKRKAVPNSMMYLHCVRSFNDVLHCARPFKITKEKKLQTSGWWKLMLKEKYFSAEFQKPWQLTLINSHTMLDPKNSAVYTLLVNTVSQFPLCVSWNMWSSSIWFEQNYVSFRGKNIILTATVINVRSQKDAMFFIIHEWAQVSFVSFSLEIIVKWII